MIKAFLRHHLNALHDGSSSATGLANCHVRGLHSIMLHNEPENRIRLFFTTIDHELWRNNVWGERMSLAYHPHHCDVRLAAVYGSVFNNELILNDTTSEWYGIKSKLAKCKYHSAINDGHGKLVDTGQQVSNYNVSSTVINQNGQGSLALPAKALHSIYVGRYECVAWLVFEGKEDPTYEPVCYTNNPQFDTEEDKLMYVPMTRDRMASSLLRILTWVSQ